MRSLNNELKGNIRANKVVNITILLRIIIIKT